MSNRSTTIGLTVLALAIAGIVVYRTMSAGPEAPPPEPAPVDQLAAPEPKVPPDSGPAKLSTTSASRAYIVPNGKVDVLVWEEVCKPGGECKDRQRADAVVVVSDKNGEVTRPKAWANGAPLRLDIPRGHYELVAVTKDQRKSAAAPIDVTADSSSSVELVIKRSR